MNGDRHHIQADQMCLVENIFPLLADAEYRQLNIKLALIGLSILFGICVFTISAILSKAFPVYRDMNKKDRFFWNWRVVCGAFGACFTVASAWSILYDTELRTNVVLATSPTSFVMLMAGVGYFVVECSIFIVYTIRFQCFRPLSCFHHVMCLYTMTSMVFIDRCHFYSSALLMMECIHPCNSLNWMLLKAGVGDTLVYKVNQFILVQSFHLRSAVEYYVWYQSWVHWREVVTIPLPVFAGIFPGLAALTLYLTPFWTHRQAARLYASEKLCLNDKID